MLDPGAYAALVEAANTEQGYRIRTTGHHPYAVEDFDGIQLVTRQHKQAPPTMMGPLPDPSW